MDMIFWLDSGTAVSSIHSRAVGTHKLESHPVPQVAFNGFGGLQISKSKVNLVSFFDGRKVELQPYVVTSSVFGVADVILGLDVLGSQLGLRIGHPSLPTVSFSMQSENSALSKVDALLAGKTSPKERPTPKSSYSPILASQEAPTVPLAPDSSESESEFPRKAKRPRDAEKLGLRLMTLTSDPSRPPMSSPLLAQEEQLEPEKDSPLPGESPSKRLRVDPPNPLGIQGFGEVELAATVRKVRKGRSKNRLGRQLFLKGKVAQSHAVRSEKTPKKVIPSHSQFRQLFRDANKYDPSEIPVRTDSVSAVLNEHPRSKESDHSHNPHVAAVNGLHEDFTYEEYETATAYEVAHSLYHDLVDPLSASLDHLDDGADIYDAAPYTILAENSDDLSKAQPIDWKSLPKRYDQHYVLHDLSLDLKMQLQDLLTTFSHTLVKNEDAIPMGQARDVPEFDVELMEGGEQRLREKHNSRPYPVKGPLLEKLKETVDTMVEQGVGSSVAPGTNTPFAFPGFFAKRPRSTKLRLCIDYVPLNRETVPSVYPIPIISDVINNIAGKKYISSLDLRSGYHQFKLTERARRYSVMVTPLGLFQFNVLGFGLRNAVTFFQSVMNNLFEKLIKRGEVVVYVDDIIIATNDVDSHLRVLREVFQILARHNLKASMDKCHFFCKQAKILGFVCNEEGHSPDPELVQGVMDFPQPRTVHNVRQFIGLAGVNQQFFSQNFNELTAPLRDLYSQKKFQWTLEADKAFNEIKKALSSAPVLAPFDFSKDVRMETDASKIAAGCVLSQYDDSRKTWRPVAFASWSFNSAQRNYSATDRELLAIVLACRKFRPFLYGRHFKVLSDHQALRGQLNLSDPFGRLARWSSELSQYDFEIDYVKGETNVQADALSRNVPLDELDAESIAAAEILSFPEDADWAKSQEADPDYAPVIRWIRDAELPSDEGLARKILKESENYAIDEDSRVLMRLHKASSSLQPDLVKYRRCVPQNLRKLVLSLYHDAPWLGAHLGRDKTYERISRDLYFPDMYRYIAVYVRTCTVCQRVKDGKELATAPLGNLPTVGRWDTLSIDLWGPLPVTSEGHKYVLTCIDSFTKWVCIIPIPNKKAITVAKALWNQVFSRYGMPLRIHHDQGKEFVNEILKSLNELLGVDDSRTTAYHPQGNAIAERIHQFFRKAVSAYVRDDQRDWDLYLPSIQLAYNDAVHDSTGFSPAELMFGRNLRSPGIPSQSGLTAPSEHEFVSKLNRTLQRAQTLVLSRLDQERLKRELKQPPVPLSAFAPNQRVMLYVPRVKPGKVHKLTPFWQGPFTVVKRAVNDKVYYLKNEFGEQLSTPVALTRLKPWHSREELDSLNRLGTKPSALLRDDVSSTLRLDDIIVRPAGKDVVAADADVESDDGDLDVSDELISPDISLPFKSGGTRPLATPPATLSLSGGTRSLATPTEGPPLTGGTRLLATPPVTVSLNATTRRMLGHEAYLTDDNKVVLKSRIAVSGPRQRKPTTRFIQH